VFSYGDTDLLDTATTQRHTGENQYPAKNVPQAPFIIIE